MLCPVNFYCPRGARDPIPCDDKHICALGSEAEYLCAAGFYVKDNSRYAAINQCLACPIGTYSTLTTEGCQPCTAGYMCYGETNTETPTIFNMHKGELCPKGHYCPSGIETPLECPPGTYNPLFGMGDRSQCRLCAAGSYNSLYGQTGCKPCGQFATSVEGSPSCECNGMYRSYSAIDASCRCLSGYDFITEEGVSQGSVSSNDDCAPLVFDRCEIQGSKDITRDPDGNCVAVDDCSTYCGGEPGVRSKVLGVCTCSNAKVVDSICNQDCRDNADQVTYSDSHSVTMTDKNGDSREVDLNDYADVFGETSCRNPPCKMVTAEIDNDGFKGVYGPPSIVTEGENVARLLSQGFSMEQIRSHRKLAVVEDQEIFNPVYCINVEDSFLFQIEDPAHYPVYMKNSVMNSNEMFDYGAFLELATEMNRKRATGDLTPSIFGFTFMEAGTYIF